MNGVLALILSLAIWRLTGNFYGWLALAAPGGVLVFLGWYLVLKE